jgi:hypothetical protein
MPRKKKASSNYFTAETEQCIIEYNSIVDSEKRAKIFTDHIYFPFYKLAENIIHTFKFYYTDVDQLEDLKHEIITMLLEEKIHKFDPSYGAKAYSYFGTIVKRWLIGYNNANYKKVKQTVDIEGIEGSYEFSTDLVEYNKITLGDVIDQWVSTMYDTIRNTFDTEQDVIVADAILTVFKSRKDITVFKKKALYIYIREITGCQTPTLTSVINKLKANFYKYYTEVSKGKVIVDY